MKVKDLIKKLECVDPEMDVYCTSAMDEYQYGLVYTTKVKKINLYDSDFGDGTFSEDEDENKKSVFVIEEN